MFNVRLAGGHLYRKQLFTWLSLVVSLMASFVLSFFPLDVLDEIWDLIESVSEGFLTYSYLDFCKTFDKIPHQCLMKKNWAYGIRGKVYKWIEEFLKNRIQRVVVNGSFSSYKKVTSGIPQGSVLAPILFVIFINDLPEVIQTAVRLYADDSKLLGRVKSVEHVNKLVNFPFQDGDVPRSSSYGVYISQLIRFARVSSHVDDFNTRNKVLTAKLLRQGYRYHKLRKAFSKCYRRNFDIVSKYNVGLKTLLLQGLSVPEFYGDLVYKFRKIIGKNDFPYHFK